jgi:hypothetical protein
MLETSMDAMNISSNNINKEGSDEGMSSEELRIKVQTVLMEELAMMKKLAKKRLLAKMQHSTSASSSTSPKKQASRCSVRHRRTGKLLCQKKARKNGMCLYHNKKRETEGMTPEQKKQYNEQAKQAKQAEIRALESAAVFNHVQMQQQQQPMQQQQGQFAPQSMPPPQYHRQH